MSKRRPRQDSNLRHTVWESSGRSTLVGALTCPNILAGCNLDAFHPAHIPRRPKASSGPQLSAIARRPRPSSLSVRPAPRSSTPVVPLAGR